MLTANLIQVTGDSIPEVFDTISRLVGEAGYTIVDRDDTKPWGGYVRLASTNADRFIAEFFPGLAPDEARLGNNDADLSPKFLYVLPGQRLSWQYHHRRAERWMFLTAGGYHKSQTDEQGELIAAPVGHEIQFNGLERHRLVGDADNPTLVAEIWQHLDPAQLSDEDDIVRLEDDYKR